MTTNKPSSNCYYQLASPVNSTKFTSKSSELLESQPQKLPNKSIKMKKSQTVINGFESKTIQSSQSLINSTSALRRRFSLFRIKRSQQPSSTHDISNNNSNVQVLQQIIEQLRHDLRIKTDELGVMRQHIENKRSSIAVSSNESIEQAMQLQTMLNSRLEEMLVENDLLKKSIQELELFAQQSKCE